MPHKKAYIELLERYHKTDHPIRGIEIGCWQGEFSACLLNHFTNMTITTIDPYVQWDVVISNTKLFSRRLNIVSLHSNVAAKLIEGSFDFVFIDGDHSYEQCKQDILNYMKFIKPGGLVSGHNFHESTNSAHPGVHKSVREIFGEVAKTHPDYTWYVQI